VGIDLRRSFAPSVSLGGRNANLGGLSVTVLLSLPQ
jgi:hypothetical protein